MRELRLNLPHARCRVWIGAGVISRVPRIVRSMFGRARVLAVADRNVRRYARGLGEVMTIPPGESTKTPARLVQLWNEFAARRVDRYTPVVAVGGGVAGDLVGFAAATYMRGVPLVQVPTTLLAQVDAAIGGKTAVNLPRGKNLAGAFYQPRAIVIDPAVLKTLPERDYRTGLAEAFKYGMIRDAALFRLFESNLALLRARDPRLLEKIIIRCVRIKLAVVRADEREAGLRMILNYGHTIGHAIEKASAYGLTHGEAISVGMNLEALVAVRMGLLPASIRERQNAVLLALGLPLAARFPERDVRAALVLDKKAKGGRVRFVLPTAIGRVRYPLVVPPRILDAALRSNRA